MTAPSTARSVTTTGTGAVSLPRTSAVVRVAATHAADGLSAALAGAESARAVVVEVARRHVEDDAVASRSLDVWPGHDEQGRRQGYEARHALTVRCADLATAGALVQELADEVGDRLVVEGVSLAAVASDEHRRTARERAFADARGRGEHLASLAGGALGEVVSVEETPGGSVAPAEEAGWLSAKAEVGFAPGTQDVVCSLTVTWVLAPG